jgi:beta-N-acetylhexosaminidase
MLCAGFTSACGTAPEDGRHSQGARADTSPRAKHTDGESRAGVDTVADVVEAMTDRQLVGQLVVTKLDGASLSTDELHALTRGELGGVILFGWNDGGLQELRRLTNTVADTGPTIQAGIPSAARRLQLGGIVAADQEGGVVRALQSLPPALGQFARAQLGQQAHRHADAEAGRQLRAAGITVNLAPVADLPVGPAFVMRGRSFGAAPAAATVATVQGMQAGGVSATVKHFPGLGGATRNTDDGVATVDRSRTDLLREDMQPFRAAAQAGAHLVMTSHAIYRGFGSSVPATVDPRITGTLLRRELGEDVVVITDSLNARGLRDSTGLTTPRLCPRAAAAGADILLLTGSLETARLCRSRVIRAMRTPGSGITRSSLEQSARRVVALKQWLGLMRDARTGQPVPAPDRRCCAP